MSLRSMNFLHFKVSQIQPRQEFIGQGHYSKVKSRSHHDIAYLQPPTIVSTKYQLPQTLQFPRYRLDKILWVKVTTARSNQSHTMMLQNLQPLTNVSTKYQLPTSYGFQDIARTRFYRSRSLRQVQRSNQGQTMWLYTYTPNLCPYQV